MAYLRNDISKSRSKVVLTVVHDEAAATYSFDRKTSLAAVLERICVDLGIGARSLNLKAYVKPDAQQLERF